MTHPVTPENVFSVPVSDPLVSMGRPQGNVPAAEASARAYAAAATELEHVAQRLQRTVGDVVGGVWIGKAGTYCGLAIGDLTASYNNDAGYAKEASAALTACANAWRKALSDFDTARRMADTAVAEEIEYRNRCERQSEEALARGDEGTAIVARRSAAIHQSDLRDPARRKAADAVHEFHAASERAAGKLYEIVESMTATSGMERGSAAVSWSAGTALSKAEWISKYQSKNAMQYLRGIGDVADDSARLKWGTAASRLAYAGAAVSFITAGVSQWTRDSRVRPDMETDRQIGRAVGAGASVAGGAALGATIGSFVCPGAGTIVGGVIGGMVGGWLADQHNDPVVDLAGDMADAVGDAWDNLF